MITIVSCVPNCGREGSFYLVVAWSFPYLTISQAFIAQTTSKWGNGKCFFMMWWKEQTELKFSLLKKTWPVPGLGICNKQSYFFCTVTASTSWGCVPGTHEKIIPFQYSPAGCGCSYLHCVAVTLQMKTDSWELHVKNLHGWALHVWAAKMQTCRTFPLARVAALSQETNIAWGKRAEKGYLQPWEKESIGNNSMWEGRSSECGNYVLHRWFWHIPLLCQVGSQGCLCQHVAARYLLGAMTCAEKYLRPF